MDDNNELFTQKFDDIFEGLDDDDKELESTKESENTKDIESKEESENTKDIESKEESENTEVTDEIEEKNQEQESKTEDIVEGELKEDKESLKEDELNTIPENIEEEFDLDIDGIDLEDDFMMDDIEEYSTEKVESNKFKRIITKIKNEINSYKDINNLTERRFYNIIKGILLIFVLLIALITTLQRVILKRQIEKDIIMITQNDFVSNLPSYIYVNKKINLNGKSINLEKILVDATATLLYFDTGGRDIDLNEYIIYILDENNKFYGTKSEEVAFNDDRHVVALNVLEPNITEFTINIIDMYTGKDTVLPFKSDKKIKIPLAKYANGDIEIKYDEYVSLRLINAKFSQAYTSLDFILETDILAGFSYVIGYGREKERITVYESGRPLRSIKSTEKIYNVNNKNTDLIKMDFNPVKSLNNKINILISEVHRRYTVDRVFGTRELLLKEIQDYHSISMDNYKVNLEGMRRYDNKIILVAHAIDTDYYDRLYPPIELIQSKNIYDPVVEEDEAVEIDITNQYANRVPVYIEATLLVHKSGEEPFELEGVIKTSREGTDILFEDDRLRNTTSADYDLRIDNILFEVQDISFDLDLKKLSYSVDSDIQEYIDFTEEAMLTRLEYKSKERILSNVTGFSNEVMNKNLLMNLYKPIDVLAPPRYDVNVDSYVINDGTFFAIVTEQWNGISRNGFEHYFNVHEIRVEEVDGNLEIVSDEVIERSYLSPSILDRN